jgi:ATP-dependent DNA helicase RecG
VAKGDDADVLSMTATPIPRSLALALYGDMTLSYIKHRPLARAGTTTRVFAFQQRGEAYEIAVDALEAGHQVYVVCPLVGKPATPPANTKGKGASPKAVPDTGEGDEYAYSSIAIEAEGDLRDDDATAAIQHARFLADQVFGGYEVGVLHGRMKGAEKRQIMDDFRAGILQVLVATTVIEVGVDVPNATVMVIEDADRFGLAQLHQLRGRVGRGEHPGHVALISASKAPTALERLAAMERTEDGFELAEYDLSLRREGDILGNRQHGASVLKLVNVVRDAAIIEAAHDDARDILAADPDLSDSAHAALRYEIARTFPAGTIDRKDA